MSTGGGDKLQIEVITTEEARRARGEQGEEPPRAQGTPPPRKERPEFSREERDRVFNARTVDESFFQRFFRNVRRGEGPFESFRDAFRAERAFSTRGPAVRGASRAAGVGSAAGRALGGGVGGLLGGPLGLVAGLVGMDILLRDGINPALRSLRETVNTLNRSMERTAEVSGRVASALDRRDIEFDRQLRRTASILERDIEASIEARTSLSIEITRLRDELLVEVLPILTELTRNLANFLAIVRVGADALSGAELVQTPVGRLLDQVSAIFSNTFGRAILDAVPEESRQTIQRLLDGELVSLLTEWLLSVLGEADRDDAMEERLNQFFDPTEFRRRLNAGAFGEFRGRHRGHGANVEGIGGRFL